MYLDDPDPLVRALAARDVLDGDWQGALAAFDSDHQINGLGLATRGDTVEQLSAAFSAHGIEPRAWYGVRLFTDGWIAAGLAKADQPAALAVELEASRRDPYRQMSRLFHLIGSRAASAGA